MTVCVGNSGGVIPKQKGCIVFNYVFVPGSLSDHNLIHFSHYDIIILSFAKICSLRGTIVILDPADIGNNGGSMIQTIATNKPMFVLPASLQDFIIQHFSRPLPHQITMTTENTTIFFKQSSYSGIFLIQPLSHPCIVGVSSLNRSTF